MNQLFDRLLTSPVMAILRGYDPKETVQLCRRAWSCGIDLVEVPIQGAGSRASLEAAVSAGRSEGRPVGAGSVIEVEQVEFAASVGAVFTVAPGYSRDVGEASARLGLGHLPGVATGSEVTEAVRDGYTWLKMFPASDLGLSWPSSMHGPFPQVRFIATGGVTLDNAGEFMRRGSAAVSLGSALADPNERDRLNAFMNTLTKEDQK